MLQVVRRQNPSLSVAQKTLPSAMRKLRYLEVAFITLASANLFAITSAVAFYVLSHKH
jgi:hypothetical protein